MTKIRKGATVVLKLDELFLWIRKQNQKNNVKNNGHINNGKKNNLKNNRQARFKIVNRPLDFNKLPPCRGKIIYMAIPKFLKTKKVVFGVQLYPPYFGLSKRVYKSTNSRKILGKISSKEFKAPLGSIWFITEKDIKGVMLRNTPRRMSKGATHMTNHLGSPNILDSNHSQNHIKHLNLRSSSKSPKFDNDQKENKENKMFEEDDNKNNKKNNLQKHFRRKSSFSMSCHYKNLSSLDRENMKDLESLFWEDTNLPSDYDSVNKKRNMQQDPKERRFKLDRWLYPIFLDFHDQQTIEIVQDRCGWELTQWIRDESEGVRTPLLRQFYDYMISLSDNLDILNKNNINNVADSESESDVSDNNNNNNNNYNSDEEDELCEYLLKERLKKKREKREKELWELDEINFEFEMMTRIKELTECVEDTIEAKFVLNVIDALDNNVFIASPILQCILKYIGNDIKFMCILYANCKITDGDKIIEIYCQDNNVLSIVWKLVKITSGSERLMEKILLNTHNLHERDAEILSIGVLNALDHNLDLVIPIFECIINSFEQNEYIYNHIKKIMILCKANEKLNINAEQMIRFGIGHPLVSPHELFIHYKVNGDKPIIDQLNILSSMQIKYEQYQLFLGRYLLYCPFKTKAVYKDEYKKEQDEIEFYDDDVSDDVDEDVDDDTALLFEFTIDIDTDFNNKQMRQLRIKKCLCAKNYDRLEYEPEHYYEDELIYKWDLIDYNKKILLLNNTPCKWIPNLKNIRKINPSFGSIEFNPEDLSNELRGYLVLLTDVDGTYNFIHDLFKKWNLKNNQKTNQINDKYMEAMHKMKERPLFVSMEKWKLTDNY